MSTTPEQDPQAATVEQAEVFEPAYKSPEDAPKTVEQIRDENVAMRTEVVDNLNAEFPRSLFDKLTGRDKPQTEVGLAQELAIEDDKALDAEKAASEKAEADATTEKARVDQEAEQVRVEKERQAKSDQERAEMQADFDEHWKQREALRKSLTRPSQIWVGVGQHVNNPDFLNESQIDAQLKQFDSDWETKQSQQGSEQLAA